jgi:hypothetical protein
MLFEIFKVFFSASIITFCSWLSGKKPELAGFIVGLPLITLMVLPFSHVQYEDPANSVRLAQSIFVSTCLTFLFFLPFLMAARLNLGFWYLYISGIVMLTAGYFIHKWVMANWF